MAPQQRIILTMVVLFFSEGSLLSMLMGSCGIHGRFGRGPLPSAYAQKKPQNTDAAARHIMEGVAHYRQGRYRQAFQAFQKALVLYRTAGDRNGQALMLRNLGVAALETNQVEDAIRYLSESLSFYRQLHDLNAAGDLLELLGRAYRRIPDYAKAVEVYEQLLQLARETANRENELIALGSLGIIYEDLKRFDKAVSFQKQVVSLARNWRDRTKESLGLWHLGEIYLENENYVQAISNFWQALLIVRELGDAPRQMEALWKLGNCYYFLGAYDKSIQHLQESLALAKRLGDKLGQSRALRTLGSVYYFQDNLERAIAYYREDLTVARELKDEKRQGTALGNLGLALSNLGKYEQALDYHLQDLAIAQKLGEQLSAGQALVNVAGVYIYLKKYQLAIDSYQKAIAIFKALGYRRGEGIAFTNMGLALFKAGRFERAEKALHRAVEILESIRENVSSVDAYHVSIFETQLQTYRYLQMTLVANGRKQEALEIAEQGRARALSELLMRRSGRNKDQVGRVPDLAEIRHVAGSNRTVFVEYSIIPEENSLYIWVVQPDGQIAFARSDLAALPGPGGSSLEALVKNSRRSLGLGGRGVGLQEVAATQQERILEELYHLLVQPIERYLPQDPDSPVAIIPQGPLFLVPFAALTDDHGNYLLDRHTLLAAPSIQTLQLAKTNRSSSAIGGNTALVVGNPAMPALQTAPAADFTRLPDLPGAELEARAIAKLLGTRPLTGEQATKQSVVKRMRDSDWIHIATHGLLDDFKGLGIPGALALAPAGSDDGLLSSAEIMDMRLEADLVVLSACDTGQGRITGDGVIGLSRSFIAAGVPSVVVSLWKVPDMPTADLMTSFYKNLKNKYTKAAALRYAMLETRRRYPQPANWAAFTLVGDSGQ